MRSPRETSHGRSPREMSHASSPHETLHARTPRETLKEGKFHVRSKSAHGRIVTTPCHTNAGKKQLEVSILISVCLQVKVCKRQFFNTNATKAVTSFITRYLYQF